MKKVLKVLWKTSVTGLSIAVLLSNTVFAQTSKIAVNGKDGKYYQYNYADLKASAAAAIVDGPTSTGAKLYEDFLKKKDSIKAFYDDTKKAYVDFSVVSKAAADAVSNNKVFDFTAFMEATSTPTIPLTTANVTVDAKGNISVVGSTGSSGGSSSSNSSNFNPAPNVSTASAINLTTIKVTFDSSVTDTIAAKTNYTLSKGTVESVVKTGDKEVTLSVSGLNYQDTTTLTVVGSSYSTEIKFTSTIDPVPVSYDVSTVSAITADTVKVELTTAPAITLTDADAGRFDIETGKDLLNNPVKNLAKNINKDTSDAAGKTYILTLTNSLDGTEGDLSVNGIEPENRAYEGCDFDYDFKKPELISGSYSKSTGALVLEFSKRVSLLDTGKISVSGISLTGSNYTTESAFSWEVTINVSDGEKDAINQLAGDLGVSLQEGAFKDRGGNLSKAGQMTVAVNN